MGLGSFSPSSHFFLTILCSAELVFKEGGNYNNVNFGTESFHSRNHVIIIIQNFTLVSLTSTITFYPVKLSFGAVVLI